MRRTVKTAAAIIFVSWTYEAAAGDNRTTAPQTSAMTEKQPTDMERVPVKAGTDVLFNAGLMLSNVDGLPKDYVQAYRWLSLSAKRGNKEAEKIMQTIASRMTPEQLAKARTLSANASKPFCFSGTCVTAQQIEKANIAEAEKLLALGEATKREEAVCSQFTNPTEKNTCLVYGPELGPREAVKGRSRRDPR